MRKLGDHPHVVPVLDTGEDDGNPFIVSRYMPGGDVEGLLAAAGGRLEVPRAVEIAADVTRALEHAHARGIVHRDLKPANVWIDDDGHARLGDFGLATTEGPARRVSGGTLVGTVAYLPPEQAIGEAAGPRSDLYSLGALLYEMLTGQPPFPGDDAVSIISQHLHADPVPPSRHNPEVPEALDRVVLALLAKRPEDRPASASKARELIVGALETKPDEAAEARPANPLESLAGGVFVGRERELDQLREAVDGALAGRGSLQLLVGRAGHRQDESGGGARNLRQGERRPGVLGPLPRGRGRARLLALGAGDPLLRPRRRPGSPGVAARRRSGRGRAADPRGGGETRHRAGQAGPTARRRVSGCSTR